MLSPSHPKRAAKAGNNLRGVLSDVTDLGSAHDSQ